ncbi:MAG: putative DNA-binding domain-containing protein [Ferrovibrio sp.]
MSGLATLQAEFSACLLDRVAPARVLPALRVPAGIDPATRLEVYRNAYVERLHEALRNDYPVLLRLIGPERFAALAYAYIAAHRSVSPSIRWFGAALPGFIAAQPSWREESAAIAMAEFEWAIGLAFDAADTEAVCAADLSAVSATVWPALRFRLHPALHPVSLSHAVPDWWLAVQDLDADAPLPASPMALDEVARHWAVWRGDTGMRFRRLDPDEAAMLHAAGQGEVFAGLCAVVAGRVGIEAAAQRAAGLLRLWIDSGWITGFGETA